MNRKIIQSLLLPLCLAGLPASGANHVVQVGEKIQDAINAAASGDVVIVRDGLHIDQGVMMIDKPIRLVREKGATVTIRGTSLTFRDLNNSTVLRDFRIENPLTIENCKQFGIEDLDLQNVTITNSNVIIRSSQIRHGDMDDSTIEIIDSQISYDINGDRNNLQVVNSTFRQSAQTDSNSTFVKSTSTAVGNFTRGNFVSHGSTFGGVVTFTSCDWSSHGTTFRSNLTSNNSHTKLLRSHVVGTLSHQHKMAGTSPDYALDCVVFQSSVNILSSLAKRTWVTYSSIGKATIGADTEEAYFTGNSLFTDGITVDSTSLELIVNNNGRTHHLPTILTGGDPARQVKTTHSSHGTSYHVFKDFTFAPDTFLHTVSNQIYNEHSGTQYETDCYMRFTYSDGTELNSNTNTQTRPEWVTKTYFNPYPFKEVTGMKVFLKQRDYYNSTEAYERNTFSGGTDPSVITVTHAKKVEIFNNSFVRVVIAGNFGGTSEIRGNLFWNADNSWPYHAISAPAPGISQDNYFQKSSRTATGGINNDFNIVGGDPGFVDATAGNYALNSNSILKDKGPADPQFNDHDGSRNDIGQYGGHMYDVNGTTSVNPVVLSGTQNIFRMRVGENTPIQIKARAAVATPAQ